jgi:hypothetical protein
MRDISMALFPGDRLIPQMNEKELKISRSKVRDAKNQIIQILLEPQPLHKS